MSRTRIRKALVIVICVVGLGVITTYAVWHFVPVPNVFARGFMGFMYILVQRKRVHLLYKTDHQVLLDACRELSRRAAAGDLKYGKYDVRSDSHPPQLILDLGPNHVFIRYDGRVMLEMMGGLDHFGVYAYPEDYKKPPVIGFKLGDKKLIDGLWYYDDGYRVRPEDYDKRIEALRPKGK